MSGIEPILLDMKQAAKLCNISRATLYRLLESKKIPHPIRIGKKVLWNKSDLELWVRLNCPCEKIFVREYRKIENKRRKQDVMDLAISYVKTMLCDRTELKHKDIPKTMAETKKELVKLGRKIKNGNHERCKK